MKIAIMQPYFFPYIGYFQLIKSVDKFIVYDDVNFIKKGWINRNKILNNNSELLFTVPLRSISQNSLISEILLGENFKFWKKKFLATIFHSYKNSSNFKISFDLIEKILNHKVDSISELLTFSLIELCKFLDIKTLITLSSETYKSNRHLKKSTRILDICEKENAVKYINLSGGTELYNSNEFISKGLELIFINTLSEEIFYNQKSKTFINNLSIIDVIMNNNKKEIQSLLNKFSLSS